MPASRARRGCSRARATASSACGALLAERPARRRRATRRGAGVTAASAHEVLTRSQLPRRSADNSLEAPMRYSARYSRDRPKHNFTTSTFETPCRGSNCSLDWSCLSKLRKTCGAFFTRLGTREQYYKIICHLVPAQLTCGWRPQHLSSQTQLRSKLKLQNNRQSQTESDGELSHLFYS